MWYAMSRASCNGDWNQLGAWLDIDPKDHSYLSFVSVWVHEGLNKIKAAARECELY